MSFDDLAGLWPVNPIPKDEDFRPRWADPDLEPERGRERIRRQIREARAARIKVGKDEMMALANFKRQAVGRMRDAGISHKKIAEFLGISVAASSLAARLLRRERDLIQQGHAYVVTPWGGVRFTDRNIRWRAKYELT